MRLSHLRSFFDRIIEWGYPDAPARNPVFAGDMPLGIRTSRGHRCVALPGCRLPHSVPNRRTAGFDRGGFGDPLMVALAALLVGSGRAVAQG
jgi:hypothetical protein